MNASNVKTGSEKISAAAKRIAADAPEGFDPFRLINMDQITTESDAERTAMTVATANDAETSRFAERTIAAKTNIGLMIFRAAILRCEASEGKVKMPEIPKATLGALGKILGLTDDENVKNAAGETLPTAAERYGYKMSTLQACVDLARGVIGGHDDVARRKVRESGESVTEKSLRTAVLAEINPDAKRNRKAGADATAAAKLALAAGRKAGAVIKVGATSVKVDAEKLNDLRNKVSASLLTDAQIAAASDEQIAATILALQLVKSAREAGAVKAPAKPKTSKPKTSKAPAA